MENLDYGVTGNGSSAALISKTGSIDFLCLPDFSSGSIFAKLLDTKKGGSFSVHSKENYEITQKYISSTNILKTSFREKKSGFTIYDWMPCYSLENKQIHSPSLIYRLLEVDYGKPEIAITFSPQINFAEGRTTLKIKGKDLELTNPCLKSESFVLKTNYDLKDLIKCKKKVLKKNYYFALGTQEDLSYSISLKHIYKDLNKTKNYWQEWIKSLKFKTKYKELIIRSALTLKLLCYEKTGAIIAAATTSLPEVLGRERNWDYRHCWLRDASMTAEALFDLGDKKPARNFIKFVYRSLFQEKNSNLKIMYPINFDASLSEKTIDHLTGYQNSYPVRIGNAAAKQEQHDIFGFFSSLLNKFSHSELLEIEENYFSLVETIASQIFTTWQKKDCGIWEFRENLQHYTSSKAMAWVGLSNYAKVAKKANQKRLALHWSKEAEKIKNQVLKEAWSQKVGSYTQSYESSELDSSNLLLGRYNFLSYEDETFIKTIEKTFNGLSSNQLMYRYTLNDGYGKSTTSFTLCTFWMIFSLFKIGQKEKAQKMFDKVLSYKNHLDLYSEGICMQKGRLLGNFPQAYSHIGFIEVAKLF